MGFAGARMKAPFRREGASFHRPHMAIERVTLQFCETPVLRMAYRVGGQRGGAPVLLLHGWPDDATTFDRVAATLHQAGYWTIAPFLRGFGQTRFLADDDRRSGEIAAMAQDVLELADALGLDRFAVVGHDWGARIAYLLSSVYPERITRCAAMSVTWDPGPLATPAFAQAKAYWYQWFLATGRGEEVVRQHGKAFARFHWDSWGPGGWFDDALFDAVAASFDNPAWADVTIHSYRVRWGEAEPDPRYADVAQRQRAAREISVPTLMIQGSEDQCLLRSSSEGKEGHFRGPFERRVMPGVGHFPTREAPAELSDILLTFLA